MAVIPLLLLWLRAAGLMGQAVALGGAIFVLVVLRQGREPGTVRAVERILTLVTIGALLVAAAQAGVLAALAASLADDAGWSVAALLGSTVGIAGMMRIGTACLGAAAALALRRTPDSRGWAALLLAPMVVLSFVGALASHAIGRLDSRGWLWSVSALHQVAAGAWVGGLICAALLGARRDSDAPERWLHRFSALAAAAVTVLALTGMALAAAYIGTPDAAIGTSYGTMVVTKIVLFTAMLIMGALNHCALHGRMTLAGWRTHPSVREANSIPLRRRLEVEAGLALVALILAASIALAPPAADVTERATLEEVLRIFTPQWPRFQTPSAAELAAAAGLGDPSAPRTPEMTAWSEFGHHVSGVFVLAMGLLAILEWTGRAQWARHWPLLIIGLTAFIAWSMDPEGWQTGTVGFWKQLLDAEVLQHRIMLVLTALFGLAEWRVRSGRHPNSPLRFVFPLVGIGAGVLLLTHVHEVDSPKTGFFMELTHLPLGLISLLAGWARWLELRLAPSGDTWPGRLWGPALAIFGLLLIFYREA